MSTKINPEEDKHLSSSNKKSKQYSPLHQSGNDSFDNKENLNDENRLIISDEDDGSSLDLSTLERGTRLEDKVVYAPENPRQSFKIINPTAESLDQIGYFVHPNNPESVVFTYQMGPGPLPNLQKPEIDSENASPDKKDLVLFGQNLGPVTDSNINQKISPILTEFLHGLVIPCGLIIIWTILIVISQILFENSLLACEEDVEDCMKWLRREYLGVLGNILMFSLIHVYIFSHALLSSRLHVKLTGLTLSLVSLVYRYMVSNGFSSADHSKINVILSDVIFLGLGVIIGGVFFTVRLLRADRKKGTICIGSLTLVIALALIFVFYGSCSQFEEGLVDNDRYQESKGTCRWERGGLCWYSSLEGVFALAAWRSQKKCSLDGAGSKFKYHKEKAEGTGFVGYPLVTKMSYKVKNQQFDLQQEIMSNLKKADPKEREVGDREVFIDFTCSEVGRVELRLRNLVKSDKEVSARVKELGEDGSQFNILNIYIENLSRTAFHRKYLMTKNFLKSRHYSNEKQKSAKAYEFFRFHSIKGQSFPNLFAATYGLNFASWAEADLDRIDTYAKKAGYITGIASDICRYNEKIIKRGASAYYYPDSDDPDHIFLQIPCDYAMLPNSTASPFSFGFQKGPFSIGRKCFLGRDISEIAMDYTHQFFDTYKTKKKFFTLRLSSGNEFSGTNHKYLDQTLSVFLEELDKKGVLTNTLVNLYSDHGDNINFLLWGTQSGRTQLMNPMFFMVVPEGLANSGEVSDTIKKNTQALISPYEIFATSMRLMGYKNLSGPDSIVDLKRLKKEKEDREKLFEKGMKATESLELISLDINASMEPSLLRDLVDQNRMCRAARIKDDCRCFIKD